jgi:ABC-type branched-subunit amino acid transport system ATPase component
LIDVPKGDLVTLIGSNGAGKTTTTETVSHVPMTHIHVMLYPHHGDAVFADLANDGNQFATIGRHQARGRCVRRRTLRLERKRSRDSSTR